MNGVRKTLVYSSLLTALTLPFVGSRASSQAESQPEAVYLGNHPELVILAAQDWGELGWNTAAHQTGVTGAPLVIAGQSFTKGLGHHANGSITVLLDGEFETFEASVGLQPCNGGGSVIFRALLDGRQVFDSGVMVATNAPKPVQVNVRGASELRLEANDAGDGITCDMANWADARLVRAAGATRAQPPDPVDIAPFGRVVTWDPNRTDGARANRIQEYRAEDVYLEKPLAREQEGAYRVPVSTNGLACVGLQWLNRRALTQLNLLFDAESEIPASDKIQVQGWFGESAWQGSWKPLSGKIELIGSLMMFRLGPGAGAIQTQKIRWLFPAAKRPRIRKLSAYTRSRWETIAVIFEADTPHKPGHADIRIINGELVSADSSKNAADLKGQYERAWNGSTPLRLTLRGSRPSALKSDPTVLQVRLRGGSFGVAIEDLLAQPRVYVPEFGISISRDPAPVSLREYKSKIAAQKTVLQQVRELPDQTMQQALARTHHVAQSQGPVLLSLACDNLKFVLERDGALRFPSTIKPDSDWLADAGEIRPKFGTGKSAQLRRELEGGWLPIPIITVEDNGIVYRQRTYVAPADEPSGVPARLGGASLCVTDFTMTNTRPTVSEASLSLSWLLNARTREPVSFANATPVLRPLGDSGLKVRLLLDPSGPLQLQCDKGLTCLSGRLQPGAQATFAVLLSNKTIEPGAAALPDSSRQRVHRYWDTQLEAAAQIDTPEPLLNNLIRSSQVRCLIAARNEADGQRIAPWIAAMSYGPLESEAHSVIRGMDYLGHSEFARRGLDYFVHRYNTNGFLTTGYTTFGTAWHMWTLGEHYHLNRDTDWLRRAAPELVRVGDWIVRQTQKTKGSAEPPHRQNAAGPATTRADGRPPEYGLMPPGVLADWNAFAYHYSMSAYYYAALCQLAAVLPDLRKENLVYAAKAELFSRSAADLRENMLQAYRWTQSQAPALPLRNGTWVPHYPSQVHSPGNLADFFPGQDAGRSWCYDVELGAHQLVPTGVFGPRDPEVGRMLNHMEDVQFLHDGWFDYPATMNEKDWFNLGGFSKVQPYYTRNCEIYALRDEVKPFLRSYFNTLAAMLNPEVLTFWEHFNHSGAWDKTHETGYFLHQTRTMLVTERDRELWLAPLVTSNWFGNGMTLSVSNAPTGFGKVSYQIRSRVAENCIEATIMPPERQAPDWVVLRLRHPGGKPIRSVKLNGKRHRNFDAHAEVVRVRPSSDRLELQVIY